ncbi:MAG: hypothetical protein KJN84_14605, partial [Bacteroidia bacterium]|nr:hypothetical protein [Bacteroidia bacterium]
MKNLIKIFSLAFFLTVVFNLQGQDAAPRSYNSIAYMKVEPGMHDEYVELEKAWQKIHQRNIDAGKYGSWHVYQVLYPNGANESYNYIVRTHLENEDQLAAYINNYSMPDDWKSILSEEEIALIDKTSEIRTWVNSEIWATLEYVSNEGDDNEITVFNFFSIPEGSSRTAHQKMENEVWKPVH